MLHDVTDDNFNSEIAAGTTFVDFWAPWCAPCQSMMPIVYELSAEFPDIKFVKANIDETEIGAEYQIRGIPSFLIFKDGALLKRTSGMMTKEKLKDWIES